MLSVNYEKCPIIRCFSEEVQQCHPNMALHKKVRNYPVFTFVSAQIEMVPQNYQKLETEEHISLMEKLIDIMEDDDDVQNIWHNWEQE